MLKYCTVAFAVGFGLLMSVPVTVHAQDAKVMAKCRAQAKKTLGLSGAPGPQQKRQFGALVKKCVENGGNL